jgi:hypothetical protein
MLFHKCLLLITIALIYQTQNVNALVEDVIDVLHLGREVIKTISSSWELADQVGVTNDIDLPFMKRKEKKILSRMAELSLEFKNAEMQVRVSWKFPTIKNLI